MGVCRGGGSWGELVAATGGRTWRRFVRDGRTLPTRSLAAMENQGSVVAAGRTNNGSGGRTMHKRLLAMVLAMSCASALADTPAASGPAGHTVGEEAAVLAALDRYMLAISANDLDAMASMQMPDGMTYRARAVTGGGMEVVGRPNSYWIDPARKDNQHVPRTLLVADGVDPRQRRSGLGALRVLDRWQDQSLRRGPVRFRQGRRRVAGGQRDVDRGTGCLQRTAAGGCDRYSSRGLSGVRELWRRT